MKNAQMTDGTRLVVRNTIDLASLLPDPAAIEVTTTHTLGAVGAFDLRGWRWADRKVVPDREQAALQRLHALITDTGRHGGTS